MMDWKWCRPLALLALFAWVSGCAGAPLGPTEGKSALTLSDARQFEPKFVIDVARSHDGLAYCVAKGLETEQSYLKQTFRKMTEETSEIVSETFFLRARTNIQLVIIEGIGDELSKVSLQTTLGKRDVKKVQAAIEACTPT